jgi:hypothetical protein
MFTPVWPEDEDRTRTEIDTVLGESQGLMWVGPTWPDELPVERPRDGESACRRGSVRPLGTRWPSISAAYLGTAHMGRAGYPCPTFGLAPGGVYRAGRVTPAAGALLPHRFTLACAGSRPPSAVCSLLHFPSGRPDWLLASTLPYGAPTFLATVPVRGRTPGAATRPTHRLEQFARWGAD